MLSQSSHFPYEEGNQKGSETNLSTAQEYETFTPNFRYLFANADNLQILNSDTIFFKSWTSGTIFFNYAKSRSSLLCYMLAKRDSWKNRPDNSELTKCLLRLMLCLQANRNYVKKTDQTAPTPAHFRTGTNANEGYFVMMSLKHFLAATVDSMITSASVNCLMNLCTWSTWV